MKSFLKQINESFQALDEKEAKPDFLDVDGDGNKKETFKKAAKDKKQNPVKKELNKSLFGKGDLDFKICEKCSGKLTPHVKDECQRCAKNEAVDPIADLDNDGELSSWEQARKNAIDKEIDEASVAADAGSYMTKNSFGPADDDTVEALGYERVSKISNKKMHTEYDQVQESMDKKYEQLIEGYRDFALSDSKMSPGRKVNASIREVAKQLKSIEETINYTSRLKTESGLSHSGFSSGTHNALKKISERLIKISERVRSLGE